MIQTVNALSRAYDMALDAKENITEAWTSVNALPSKYLNMTLRIGTDCSGIEAPSRLLIAWDLLSNRVLFRRGTQIGALSSENFWYLEKLWWCCHTAQPVQYSPRCGHSCCRIPMSTFQLSRKPMGKERPKMSSSPRDSGLYHLKRHRRSFSFNMFKKRSSGPF